MSPLLAALALAAAVAAAWLARQLPRAAAPHHTRVRRLDRQGLPVPAIARRTGLSQDAVRVALAVSPARRPPRGGGSFFRVPPVPPGRVIPLHTITQRHVLKSFRKSTTPTRPAA